MGQQRIRYELGTIPGMKVIVLRCFQFSCTLITFAVTVLHLDVYAMYIFSAVVFLVGTGL